VSKCVFCRKEIATKDLRDALSIREFHISGLCQECQDDVFTPEEEEEVEDSTKRVTLHLNDLGMDDTAVITRVIGKLCPICDEYQSDVLIFGLTHPADIYDNAQIFYWCACGYKWIDSAEDKALLKGGEIA